MGSDLEAGRRYVLWGQTPGELALIDRFVFHILKHMVQIMSIPLY
jgi:hypothetical protein